MTKFVKYLSIGILLLGLILINWIASMAKNARIDTTSGNIYSLTSGTKELLKDIEGDIEIDFYFSRSREGVPVNLKNQADRILSLLWQFANNYKAGEFAITVIDPKPDTDEEEDAEKSDFGIKGRFGQTLFYTGIKIVYEGEEANINFLHESEAFLEHEVITTIYGLANDEKPIVGLINTMDRMEENQPFFQKIKQIYDIESIGATATALPEKDFDAILILHPKNLPDSLLYDVDQYLLGGGKLFVAVDPSAWIDQYANGNMPNLPIGGFQMPNKIDANSDLDKLFKSWGVKYDKTQVLADLSAQVPMPKMGEYPAYIRIDGKTEIKPNDLTQNTNLLLFMEPGFFSLEDSGLTLTPLVQATPNAGWLNASDLPRTQSLYPQYPFDPFQVSPRTMMNVRSRASSMNASIKKDGGEKRYLIAGILKGAFKTAFPDGKPPGDPKTPTGDNKPDKPLIKEGDGNSEVVLFADFDFFNTIFQRYQTTDTMRPVSSHNSILALNLIDYLVTGEKHLSAVRIKGESFRPFEVMQELEAKRQEKLNEENKKIDEEIQKANQNLESELAKINQKMQLKQREAQMKMLQESRKQQALLEPYRKFIRPDGTLSLDKKKDAATIQKLMVIQQQMEEIRGQVQEEARKTFTALQADINVIQEQANDKISDLEKKKRKTRKEGREDIEAMELKVQLANMVIMPLLVIGLGITFFSTRKNRR